MIHFITGRIQRICRIKHGLFSLLCCFIAGTGAVSAQLNELPVPLGNQQNAYHTAMVTDVGATALASPAAPGCYGTAENVSITIMNYNSSPIDFSTDPVTVTVNVTGAVAQTLTATVSTGTLAPSATMNVNAGTLNMTTAGTYTFNANTSAAGDGNTANDAMTAATRITYGLAALPQTVSFSGFTGGNLATAFPGWREASGTGATGTTSFWTFQNNVGTQGNSTARVNLFTTTRNEWLIGPKFLAGPNTTMRFKVAVTDQGTTSNPDVMGPDDKVRVMVSSDCGATWTAAMTFDAAYNLTPVLTQYGLNLGAYSGQEIMVAFYATDGPVDDINNYDFHIDDINISNVTGIDLGVIDLAAPSTSGCLSSNETVTVNLRNHGFTIVDFGLDNTTVTVNVSGPNPQTFNTTISNGTLAPGAVMPVTVSTGYDMSMAGIYTFTASSTVQTSDYDLSNDAMPQSYVVSTRPSVTVTADDTICDGSSTMLSAAGTAFGPAAGDVAFSTSVNIPIPSQDTIYSTINVTSPLYAFEIYSVTIDSLYHSYDADVDIYLIAPNGSRIELSSDNGTNGDNYIGTRFISSAPGSIISGIPPFTGDYIPEQPFGMLSGSANGTWTLQVIDDASGDDGTLKGWSLNMRAPNSIASYSWSPATGLSSATISNPVASPPATTSYTVTVTDQNGCTSTEDVLITVNPSPSATVIGTNVSCSGGNDGSATVTASGGTGSYSYLWSDGQTAQTATGLIAGNYSVTVSDANACAATVPVSITEPAPLVATASSTVETCSPGNDGTATVVPAGGSGNYTFSWNDPASQITQTATGLSAGTYTVTINDAVCGVITTAVTVNAAAPPVVTASNDTTICEGSSATLIASGGISYTWDNNAGSNDTVSVSPVNTTVYTVTVSDNNGCTATEQVSVSVTPLAVASFTYNNTGSTVIFTNGSLNALSYSWDFGDGSLVDNSLDPSYTYPSTGTYTVTLVASNGCNSDTITDVVVISATGMEEAGSALTAIVPNPSEGIFSIMLSEGGSDISIEVLDMQGKLVYSRNDHNTPGSYLARIDLTSLAKGTYYLKLITSETITVKKIVIQ